MSRTAVLLVQEDGGETQAQSVEYPVCRAASAAAQAGTRERETL